MTSFSEPGFWEEECLGPVLQVTPQPVVAVDVGGAVRFWNRAAEAVFGWSAGEVVGRHCPLRDEDEDVFPRIVARITRGEGHPPGQVVSCSRKDGSQLDAALWAAPITDRNGDIVGVAGVFENRDEAEHLWIRERLRRSESRFGTLFQEAADAMFLHEADGRIVDANREACRSLGYTREELREMHIVDLVVNPGPKEKTRRLRHLQPGDHLRGVHAMHRRKDGTLFPVETEITIVDFEGRSLALATSRDVSERKALEEELQRSQKLRAVGRLAGGIAHEFNNDLTAILTLTGLLLEDEDDPSVKGDLEQIVAVAHHSTELTRRLLGYSRMQIQRPELLRLDSAVHELETMLRHALPIGVDLALDLDPATGHLEADPVQLRQILLNLTDNAQDAMPEGGTLTIRTGEDEEDEWVRLEVEDTGEGMEPEVLERVFEPFFTTREVGAGAGLGLSTVHGIVEQSGGEIRVQSEPGQGSRFVIRLPRKQP